MSYVAAGSSLRLEIAVVLRNCAFVHRGAEVRGIRQILGQGVVRQETQAVGIFAAHIHVAGVIPALRGVFEQVDGADWEGLALNDSVGAAGSQDGSGYEAQSVERATRAERSRARRGVVDEVRA